jgi:hypothetical protein
MYLSLRGDGTRSAIVPRGPYRGFEADTSSLFDCRPSNGAFACAFVEQVIAESTTLNADCCFAVRGNGSASTKSASFLSGLYGGQA